MDYVLLSRYWLLATHIGRPSPDWYFPIWSFRSPVMYPSYFHWIHPTCWWSSSYCLFFFLSHIMFFLWKLVFIKYDIWAISFVFWVKTQDWFILWSMCSFTWLFMVSSRDLPNTKIKNHKTFWNGNIYICYLISHA